MTKIYTYKNCDTCKKATSFLKNNGVEFTEIAIRETPPSIEELNIMLKNYNGNIQKLFNTSGVDYRALDLKNKLKTLSIDESLALLNSNGNLVKRPFFLNDETSVVGFKETDWEHVKK